MHRFIDLFTKAGELKDKKQRGFVLRDVDNPPSVAAHSFRETLMAWLLSADTGLNQAKLLKLIALHDLVAGAAGDLTPYEPYLEDLEEEADKKEVFKEWVRLPKEKKEKFAQKRARKEQDKLDELFTDVPREAKKEAQELWKEFENLGSPEAQFVFQLDILEVFMQALQYWEDEDDFAIDPWWQRMKENIHHPKLLDFLQELEDRYHG